VTNPYGPPALQQPVIQSPYATTADDRTMAMLCHLLAILTWFVGPLVIWLVKKDSSRFVDHHGRESLNFQLTIFLASICLGAMAFVLMFFFIGILLIPVLMAISVLALIAEIMAGLAASRGEWHRYPCTIRFF
jgi:uncharacterized Tic20 family protein